MSSPASPDLMSSPVVSHRGTQRLVSDESWGRLALVEWARIGFTTYDGIQILPVQYVLDDHALVFSTPADGVLAQLADLTCRVACEVDRQNADASAAWHVLMHGTITHRDNDDQGTFRHEPGAGTVTLQFVPATMAAHRF